MAAVYVSNIVINAGADFSQVFTLESSDSNSALNLSGYSIHSQLRKYPQSSVFVDFDSLILNPVGGQLQISLPYYVTSSIKPGRYVYDIVVTDPSGSVRTRVIEGMALVREGVTKNV